MAETIDAVLVVSTLNLIFGGFLWLVFSGSGFNRYFTIITGVIATTSLVVIWVTFCIRIFLGVTGVIDFTI